MNFIHFGYILTKARNSEMYFNKVIFLYGLGEKYNVFVVVLAVSGGRTIYYGEL